MKSTLSLYSCLTLSVLYARIIYVRAGGFRSEGIGALKSAGRVGCLCWVCGDVSCFTAFFQRCFLV